MLPIVAVCALTSSAAFGYDRQTPPVQPPSWVIYSPSNPPPNDVAEKATRPTVYMAKAVAPTGGYKIYTGFGQGTFPTQYLPGADPEAGRTYLIGYGVAPTLKYNTIIVNNSKGEPQNFEITSSNYFLYPNGHFEVVTQIAFIQPSGNTIQAISSTELFALVENTVVARFADSNQPSLSASDPQGAGPNPPKRGLNPNGSNSTSRIHAIIISGYASSEVVLAATTKTTLVGGVVALGRASSVQASQFANWSRNLTITPDQDLLEGKKIPPITPNIVDIRIRHYSVEATIDPIEP